MALRIFTRTILVVGLLVLLVFPSYCRSKKKNRGSKWWGLGKSGEPNNLVDNSIHPGAYGSSTATLDPALLLLLNQKQRRLVRENPGSLVAIHKGMVMALTECELQFQNRRWNCPTTDYVRGRSIFGKIVERGSRETAFVYAITSAAVVHAVSRACSEGLLESCTCDYRHKGRPAGDDWEWGGCSDNVHFGRVFAKQFVDAPERGRDFRNVMNLHNNEAGRTHVTQEMRRECKCHGMSGSCTVQTCWMRLPLFGDIGNRLKDRFDGASRVLVNNAGNAMRPRKGLPPLKPANSELKAPTSGDLIYYEESPDFCRRDPKAGTQGTQGRHCNDSSLGVEGCELMCCSRGHKTEVQEVLERCSCTFHWCCNVTCQYCKAKKTVHTCL